MQEALGDLLRFGCHAIGIAWRAIRASRQIFLMARIILRRSIMP